MLIGRKREIERLNGYRDSGKSEFVAVYGRRRVGKTFLIRETFENKFFFYYTGSVKINTVAGQLERFADALSEYGMFMEKPPKTWIEAFDCLRAMIKLGKDDRRKVIFIDEMPWLDLPKSDFLAALEYFWNSFASARKDVLFIACGSATSWITKKLFKDRGGLHNRVTGKIFLQPFTLNECEEFLSGKGADYGRYDVTECYMVFGGIPYYLDYIEKKYSLAVNVDHIVFDENAPLLNEFEELYASLFNNSERYIDVVKALGKKMKGLTRNEIVEATKLTDGGNLSEILNDLELSGFIRRYNAYPNKRRGSLYQLVDNFTLFSIMFFEKKRPTSPRYWSGIRNTPTLNAWRGYAFEIVCLRHIEQIEQGLGISGVLTSVSSWRISYKDADDYPAEAEGAMKRGAQIDLVIEREDRVVNLCEIKYAQSEYDIDKEYADRLRHKSNVFVEETKTRKTPFLTMITTYGIKRNKYMGVIRAVVTMDALFMPPPFGQ
jgi:AAA+ ATPase superfamily predicted ATPase